MKFMSKFTITAIFSIIITAAAQATDKPENLSLAAGVKASASSVYMKYTADKAIDGNAKNMDSRWLSEKTEGERSITIDFGKEVELCKAVYIFWTPKCVGVDYDIMVKDGESWKTVKEVRGGEGNEQTITFTPVKTTALKTVFLKTSSDNHVRLYELETYAK